MISKELTGREEDVLYEAELIGEGQSKIKIVVLFAHQSRSHPHMAFRLLAAMVRLWEYQLDEQKRAHVAESKRRLKPIVPLLVYTGERPWRVPPFSAMFPEHQGLAEYLPSFKIETLDLTVIEEETLTKHESMLGYVLALFRAQWQGAELFEETFGRVLQSLAAVSKSRELLLDYVWFCVQFVVYKHGQSGWDKMVGSVSKFIGQKEGQVMAETMADIWFKEGKLEGKLEGHRELLLNILTQKFADKTKDEIWQKLEAIKDTSALELLSKKIFSAKTWDEFWA